VVTRPIGRARRRVRWRALWGLATAVLLPAIAGAHAVLVRAVPPPRATVRVAPRRARLWFSERLEPVYSTASVWSEGTGTTVAAGPTAVSGDDPRLLSLALPPLPSGAYAVRYRVLAVDGHVVEGAYSFTVAGGATGR
jgi:copper resistance protein C